MVAFQLLLLDKIVSYRFKLPRQYLVADLKKKASYTTDIVNIKTLGFNQSKMKTSS